MSRRKSRRGVTLIFVVSIIALFMLLGATFAVVSANYLRSAKQIAKKEIYNDPPQVALDRVLYTLLRGTFDINSPFRGHSLAGDKYAYTGLKIVASSAGLVTPSGNQFMVIEAPGTGLRFDGTSATLSRYAGAYNGQELTFIEGPASGISCRVVGYSFDTATSVGRFFIMLDNEDPGAANFFNRNADGSYVTPAAANTNLANKTFILNPRPFIGKGAGQLVGGNTNPDAIAHNVAAFEGIAHPNSPLRIYRADDITSGIQSGYTMAGINESYDAADFQNVFLSAEIQNTATYDNIYVLPSFHRPALLRHAYAQGYTSNLQLRPFFMGPIYDSADPVNSDANPEFPGIDVATAAASPMTQVGQVDCNGDYIPDSIWIDPGFPIQTDVSGRNYKILCAQLIVDMDGKINVNAAGTKYQSGDPTVEPLPGYADSAQAATVNLTNSGGGNVPTTTLIRRGQGVGPAEINIRSVIHDDTEFSNFMAGTAGRYGTDAVAGIAGQDPVSRSQLYGYPAAGNFTGNWCASFFDIKGRTAVGIDLTGAPRFDNSTLADEYQDHPYELNLVRDSSGVYANSNDAIYSVGEIERILRPYDIDAGTLPDRLWKMSTRLNYDAPTTSRNNAYRTRRSVTTHSFDLPVPNDDVAKRLVDILAAVANIEADTLLNPGSLSREELISNQASGMLGRDVMMGMRMNLNWAFGNGLDDNGNLVRDEPSEAATEMINGVAFDQNLDGANNAADAFARQAFARKLYVLTLLFNRDLMLDLDDGSAEDNGTPTRIEARKIIAQWVANVVDFRDQDSIMTGVEFDLNPFDGWHLDGNVATDESTGGMLPDFEGQSSRFIAWGSERPELLITETVAAHDRRTEDRADDRAGNNGLGVGIGPPSKKTTDATDPDEDFDQRVRPRGLCYIEFFNPWNDTTEVPMELYTDDGTKVGVDLKKLTPVGNSPVFRVLFVKDTGRGLDPDTHSSVPADQILPADRERSIYFCNQANIPADVHGVPYIPNPTVLPTIGVIGVQEYAVVGSEGTENGGVYTMPIGMRTDADLALDLKIPETRRIELEPATNQFRIYQTDALGTLVGQTRSCVVIPLRNADLAKPDDDFTVSEPAGGYATPADHDYQDNGLLEFSYSPSVDTPFDRDRPDSAFFDQDGTVTNFREVHLQRLANPLLPWNAVTNPYRTIDTHSVDMTVFNGIDKTDLGDTEEEATMWVNDGEIEFSSLERGEHEVDLGLSPAQSRLLWKHEPNSPAPAGDDAMAANDTFHFFRYNLEDESLGRLNIPYDLTTPRFAGGPISIPWLKWNNRPFISQLELMMVPKSRSSRLLHDFSIERTAVQPYNPTAFAAPDLTQNAEYGHLLNFFQSSSGATEGPNLHRLFEYTHVPSLFAGTQHQLNPFQFTGNGTGSGINGFNAPYNQVSSYQYPGQVNLSTIYQRQVYEAIFGRSEVSANSFKNGFTPPSWSAFVQSRAGYSGAVSGRSAILNADPSLPTFFSNPFRAPNEGNMVPELSTPNALVRPEVETGLLRSSQPASYTDNRKPLFDTEKSTQQPYDDDDRNPYFRYESIQRLENLTTTRSNVFAIWITIGYFEVDQEGKLGKELGSDTGAVKRHRMFSMVDRSIPFAFEPGKNHNIDKIILSKRYIE